MILRVGDIYEDPETGELGEVTKKILNEGRISINDLTFPVPGQNFRKCSINQMLYGSKLRADGLDLSDLAAPDLDIRLDGFWRKLFVVPEDLRLHVEETEHPAKRNVLLSFTLPPSTYATMLLR